MQTKKFFLSIFVSSVLAFLAYFYISYLPRAFSGDIIPKAEIFSIGYIAVRWYGLLIAIGALAGYILAEKRLVKNGVSRSKIEKILLVMIISGLIGARIGFVIQNVPFYSKNIIEIFAVWHGGLSIQGAMIAGIIGLLILAKKYKLNFLVLANSISPHIMLSSAIGRYGNFFNQEIVGKPSERIPWKMFVAESNRPVEYESFSFYHPVFLYESILLILAYVIYLLLRNKYGDKIGFAYTLVLYSAIRIIVEFFRIDYRPIFLYLDLAQWVSIAIMTIGLIVGVATLTRSTNARGQSREGFNRVE